MNSILNTLLLSLFPKYHTVIAQSFRFTLPPGFTGPASSSLLEGISSGTASSLAPKNYPPLLQNTVPAEQAVFPYAPLQLCLCIVRILHLLPCPVSQKTTFFFLFFSQKSVLLALLCLCSLPLWHFSEICNLFISFFRLDLRAHGHKRKTSLPLPPLLLFQNKLYSFLLIFQPHELSQHVSIIPIK